MEKFLEYTRTTFEKEHIDIKNIECIHSTLNELGLPCICIPGVAMNFCMNVAGYCHEVIGLKQVIQWNNEHNVYLPKCVFNEKCLTPNLHTDIDIKKSILSEFLCDKKVNSFMYVKNRYFNANYKSSIEDKDDLLFGISDRFPNGGDYFKLFLSVAEMNRYEKNLEIYADKLFRLFLFLFPYTAQDVIYENQCQEEGNESFFKVNKKIISEYKQLGALCRQPKATISDKFNYVKDFVGFDLMVINRKLYQLSPDKSRDLKNIINYQASLCSKVFKQKKFGELIK